MVSNGLKGEVPKIFIDFIEAAALMQISDRDAQLANVETAKELKPISQMVSKDVKIYRNCLKQID